MNEEDLLIPHFPVGFRIGSQLKDRVELAAERAGISQNRWMLEAINGLLELGEPEGTDVTAELLLHQKVPTMVRVPPLMLELMNEHCEERDMPRTVFLLDALLTKLARNGA